MPHKDPEARRAYMRAYFLATKEARREKQLAYLRKWRSEQHLANPEKFAAKKRAWYARNPGAGAAQKRAWVARNPEKAKAIEARRAAKRKAERPPHYVYCMHRASAGKRNIPFLLTFDEWWKLWEDSGVFMQRGRRSAEYCMARTGDIGPYAVGNVRICPNSENAAERNRNQRGKKITQRGTNSVLSAPVSSTDNL